MGWTQIVFGTVLVVVILFVSLWYGVRQLVFLRRMRLPEEMPPGEWSFQRGQVRRRLVMSFLLLLLAVMLAAALIYLEDPAERLRVALEQQGDNAQLDPDQRGFARLYGTFWIVFLLVLMVVVLCAAYDFWATRRYGIRQHRKLVADRRDMIEREIARLRQERNGHD